MSCGYCVAISDVCGGAFYAHETEGIEHFLIPIGNILTISFNGYQIIVADNSVVRNHGALVCDNRGAGAEMLFLIPVSTCDCYEA